MNLERREGAIVEFSAMGFFLALLPLLCLVARKSGPMSASQPPVMRPSPLAQAAPQTPVARAPAGQRPQPAVASQSINEIARGIRHEKLSSDVEAILEERGMSTKGIMTSRHRGLDVALPENEKDLAEQIIAAVKAGDVPATVSVSIDDTGKILLKIREESQ